LAVSGYTSHRPAYKSQDTLGFGGNLGVERKNPVVEVPRLDRIGVEDPPDRAAANGPRGSLIAPTVAHGINNGLLMLLRMLALGD
jgi:hypothetical protein